MDETTTEALDALAPTTGVPAAAAERLLTGRLAEAFVLDNAERVLGVGRSAVDDLRESISGFDFRIDVRPEVSKRDAVVVEMKGRRGFGAARRRTGGARALARGRREDRHGA